MRSGRILVFVDLKLIISYETDKMPISCCQLVAHSRRLQTSIIYWSDFVSELWNWGTGEVSSNISDLKIFKIFAFLLRSLRYVHFYSERYFLNTLADLLTHKFSYIWVSLFLFRNDIKYFQLNKECILKKFLFRWGHKWIHKISIKISLKFVYSLETFFFLLIKFLR